MQDLDLYQHWYGERFKRWNYGENPGEDPRDLTAFATFITDIGKVADDLTIYGAPFRRVVAPAPAPAAPSRPPLPVFLDTEGIDMAPLIWDEAQRHEFPTYALQALIIAESGYTPDPYATRFDGPTATAIGKRGLEKLDADMGDEAGWVDVQRAIELCAENGTPLDISFGLGQFIVTTAGARGVGDGSLTVTNILIVRDAMFKREIAIPMAARDYARCLRRVTDSMGLADFGNEHLLQGLITYNSGSPQPRGNRYWQNYAGNAAAYQQALSYSRGRWP